MIKTYIILREDLSMSVGKAIVQGGHAMDLVWSIINEHPTERNIEWAEIYHRRKVALRISSLEKLENLKNTLKENKILFFNIYDNGITEFDNVKTLTGIVIPPYKYDEELPKQLKRLQLYK